MRQIKFRAWDGKRLQFLHKGDFEMCYTGILVYHPDSHRGDEGKTVDWPLMQYSGIEDCKGIEIYEEDILKHEHSDTRFICMFVNGAFCYTSEAGVAALNPFDIKGMGWEVIGNIHENPELLEAVEK